MPNLFTKVEMPAISSEILHSDKIMLMGSCFADNIGERLKSAKFNCLATKFISLEVKQSHTKCYHKIPCHNVENCTNW